MKKKSFIVRLDPDLHKRIRIASIENEFSLNSFVVNAFNEYLKKVNTKENLKWTT